MNEALGSTGFDPPPYPHDRVIPMRKWAEAMPGGCIDLSIGTPCDPPPAFVVEELAASGAERGYPPSIGTPAFRQAVIAWIERRLGEPIEVASVAACIGTKEFVASLPHYLRLRTPTRDTVLYPAVSYPTYAMGAMLARARAVPVPMTNDGVLRLDAIKKSDVERALCLWVNVPGNPAGNVEDLGAVAEWGRSNGVLVASDECYVEFTWDGPPRSVLNSGTEGVLALHSLSKRSNLAGVRAGFYAGDAKLVHYLSEVRKHAGAMMPGPVQAAAVAALGDDHHVDEQRERYWKRLVRWQGLLERFGLHAPLPQGGFYLWVPAPDGDGWALTERLAAELGVLVSPGEFYGEAASGYVRLALVCDETAADLVESRLDAFS